MIGVFRAAEPAPLPADIRLQVEQREAVCSAVSFRCIGPNCKRLALRWFLRSRLLRAADLRLVLSQAEVVCDKLVDLILRQV